MSGCCVSGCKNRHSSSSKLKFYRIPSGYRPFQANRRRLWLQAIQRVNGSTQKLKGNARVCGAHFISGEASMDFDSPDFVPSVFTCTKQSQSPKKQEKRFYGCRKRGRRTGNAPENKTTPQVADSAVDAQSSVLMEETQTQLSPSLPEESVTLTEEPETATENKTTQLQATSSPHEASASLKVPADIAAPDRMIPVVLLKSVYTPACGFKCERCNQNYTNAPELVKHVRLHENKSFSICEICGKLFTSQTDFTEHQRAHEPFFPCNMCDRTFTTSHHLKRHKLQHVRDGRKCHKCGALFCQRHNHVMFLPQTELEEDLSTAESQLSVSNSPEKSLLENSEPDHPAHPDNDAQSTITPPPLQTTVAQADSSASSNHQALTKIRNPLPPPSHRRIISEIPLPVSFVPRRPTYSRKKYPVACVQLHQNPELPPSLKMFSPQYLTSAFLEVTRNYEYILNKTSDGKNTKNIVKEEPCKLPLSTPGAQSAEHINKERTAYDVEVAL